jgi:hypothetical protein
VQNGLLELAIVQPAKRAHVDHKAVLRALTQHPFVGFVDPMDGNDFDIGGDVVLAAAVGHLARPGMLPIRKLESAARLKTWATHLDRKPNKAGPTEAALQINT